MTEKIMHKNFINYIEIKNLYENNEDLITCEISGTFYYNFIRVGELISVPIILPLSTVKIGLDFPKNLPYSFSYFNKKISVRYFLIYKKYTGKNISIRKEKIKIKNDLSKVFLNSNFILDRHNFFIESHTENFINALRKNEKIDEEFLKNIEIKNGILENYAHKKAILIKNLGCIFISYPNIFTRENNTILLTYECKIKSTIIKIYREENNNKNSVNHLVDQYEFISNNLYKYNFSLNLKDYKTFNSNLICINYYLEFNFDNYAQKIKISVI